MVGSGIYTITNTVNGKVYIGSTKDFSARWVLHKSDLRLNRHGNPHLQSSWNKYSEEAFEFGVLEYLDDLKKLHLAERFWCEVYKLEGKELYNIGTPGKAPMLGKKHTKESKRKMSAAKMGHGVSEESRCKMSRSAKNRLPISEKTRRKMKTRSYSKETRLKMSKALMGHKVTQDTRKKIRKANLGMKHSKESKVKMRKAQQEMSTEVRAEINRKIGKANARPYPSFIHYSTGEIIPVGVNLAALCRRLKLNSDCMRNVIKGRQGNHKGWMLNAPKAKTAVHPSRPRGRAENGH